MTKEVEEWISKAEGDWSTMEREFAVTKSPNYDAVCFHAQQCAEKYLKGRLVDLGIPFPKIHDLPELLDYLPPGQRLDHDLLDSARIMSSLAVEIRYPGMKAWKSDAKRAIRNCEKFRSRLRKSLGLEN